MIGERTRLACFVRRLAEHFFRSSGINRNPNWCLVLHPNSFALLLDLRLVKR